MKLLFKRRKQQKSKATGLYALFDSKINRLMHYSADWLQDKTERLTDSGKKLMLALFLCLFGGCSLYIGIKGLLQKDSPMVSVSPPLIPAHITSQGRSPISTDGNISVREYEVIRSFHRYLDSLQTTESGRKRLDSLLMFRPGLRDSLTKIEMRFLNERR